jgi:hypothetical protein
MEKEFERRINFTCKPFKRYAVQKPQSLEMGAAQTSKTLRKTPAEREIERQGKLVRSCFLESLMSQGHSLDEMRK